MSGEAEIADEQSLLYVVGPEVPETTDIERLPIRLRRTVKDGSGTEISVVTVGGHSLGIYGIVPRLLTRKEADELHRAQSIIESRSLTVDKDGRRLVSACFRLHSKVAEILENAAYVKP